MGCNVLEWVADPLGGPLSDALGVHSPLDFAVQPWRVVDYVKSDWRALKHLLVPDMRRDRETMVNGPLTPRRRIYGTARVSGQLAYAESTGDKNEFLHLIVILAGHRVSSFGAVSLDDKLAADFGDKVHYELFNGTQTEACASLVAASNGLWTADHKLLGCAYIYLKLTYDEGSFPSGLPTVKVVVNGALVSDPRSALYTWSDNPALCALDYMLLGEDEGGMGCDEDEVDYAAIVTAANICDQQVVKNPGGTEFEKRYTCNGTLDLDNTPKALLNAILQSMGGTPVYSQGVWKIQAAAYIAPAITIDETWLNGGIQFKVGSTKAERFNTVTGTFVDPSDHWAAKGFPTVTSSAYVADDDGEELTTDLTLNFTTSPTMAQRLAKIIMEQSRHGQTVDYPCNMKAFKLAPFDTLGVNNANLGWAGRTFRVDDWGFSPSGGVKLALRQEDSQSYSWVPGDVIEVTPPPATILPDPRVVYPPTNIVLTPRKYETNSGMSARVDLDITWDDGGNPGAPRYEVQYKLADDLAWAPVIPAPGTAVTIPGLAAGDYDIQVRAINSIGAQSTWVTVSGYVPETTDTVPNVTGLELIGLGNATEWTGEDFPFRWNYVAPPGNNPLGGLAGRANSWFRYYKVEIYDGTNTLRWTDHVIEERYTYKYGKNCVDGNGTPTRTVKIKVWVMAAWGELSPVAAELTVSNPNIAQLPALAVTGAVNLLSVGLPRPADIDFAGFRVHASQVAGFTPDGTNLINDGGPETVVTKIGLAPGVWYVKAAGYDRFGIDGLNWSDEYSATVSSLLVVPEMLDAAARSDFLVRDTILYFDVAVLKWDAGAIDRADQSYTLAAGELADANASYVLATFEDTGHTAALSLAPVASGLPVLTADQAIIAVTGNTTTPQGNYICYVRQGNSIQLEGALLRFATITDAHITGTLSANKIQSLNGSTQISGEGINLLNLGETATWSGVSSKPGGSTVLKDAPAGAGLAITSTCLGYYNGSSWAAYLDYNGNFRLGDPSTAKGLDWNQASGALTVRGTLYADDIIARGNLNNLVITPFFTSAAKGHWSTAYNIENSGGSGTPPRSWWMVTNVRDTYADETFSVSPGEVLSVSAWLESSNTTHLIQFGVRFFNAAGAGLGGAYEWQVGANLAAGQPWTLVKGTITVPAGAASAAPWCQIDAASGFGYARFSDMYMAKQGAILADNVVAGTITGSTLQTAVAGAAERFVVDRTTNKAQFYGNTGPSWNNDGVLLCSIGIGAASISGNCILQIGGLQVDHECINATSGNAASVATFINRGGYTNIGLSANGVTAASISGYSAQLWGGGFVGAVWSNGKGHLHMWPGTYSGVPSWTADNGTFTVNSTGNLYFYRNGWVQIV